MVDVLQHEENVTLTINCFAPRVVVDFGDVKSGCTCIRSFVLDNPKDEVAIIHTAKFPKSKTLLLNGYTRDESQTRVYRLPARSITDVNIAWKPEISETSKGMREIIELECEGKRFHVTLVGHAVGVKQKKKAPRRLLRKENKENQNVSLTKEIHTDEQRFKGITKETRMKGRTENIANDRKVLGDTKNVKQHLAETHTKTKKNLFEFKSNDSNIRTKLVFQPTSTDVPSPFKLLDEPVPTKPVQLDEPPKTPLTNLQFDQEELTPRKRRTWGAPELFPIGTPNVTTRGMKKLQQDESNKTCIQQTFMECHTMAADSILAKLSPPDKECDRALGAPFTPPKLGPMIAGPLTATPLPLSLKNTADEVKGLPCFDASIIAHVSPEQSHRLSEKISIAAIETTTSTANNSIEEGVEIKAPVITTEKKPKPEPKVTFQAPKKASKPMKQDLMGAVIIGRKGGRNERPKTAPHPAPLSRRTDLRKNLLGDVARPGKRRSLSADRITGRAGIRAPDIPVPSLKNVGHVKPVKRKDLLTPNMPGTAGFKRPLQKTSDLTFKEKRYRSCDMSKEAQVKSSLKITRRSVAPNTTRVKMHSKDNRKSSVIPRHPLALSQSKNMYFDERWKVKQERGFGVWMNFYLCLSEGGSSLPMDYQATRDIWKNAPKKTKKNSITDDGASRLTRVQAERKLLQSERRASAIYQSAELVLLKLEQEINDERLSIRKDRKLDADLGLKDQLIDLLLCYNPIWLRLGLEVLYEEMIPLSSHRDMPGILNFLSSRFVNDPVIRQRYAHTTVPGSYSSGYHDELRKFTMKKFMMLVLLLDMSKKARVIENDPCLFCLNAPHKSSRSVLISFSNLFLSGEGDITKHLNNIGYIVQCEQNTIEEMDYRVKRIETDLRDGTKLTRLVEVITECDLTSKLRVPAHSRLQKIHNVGLMLTKLQEEGVVLENTTQGNIESRAIVDGNYAVTLELVWSLIYQYCINQILDEKALRTEIDMQQRQLRKRFKLKDSTYDNDEGFVLRLTNRRLSVDERLFYNSSVLSALLDWCRVVCSFYDVPVDNFTTSFADGRIFCLLLHHYHPRLVPLTRIQNKTSLAHQEAELDLSSDFLSKSAVTPDLYTANEKENFKLLNDALKGLSGVPAMIFSSDFVGTMPDEKVVITFLSYLCASLIDMSLDERSAIRIQRHWRHYKYLSKIDEMRAKRRNIIKLQALMKGVTVRRTLDVLRANREKVLAEIRRNAALRIQQVWKDHKAVQEYRKDFHKKRQCAVIIQRAYRAILSERWKDKIAAATIIQSHYRSYVTRKQYLEIQCSITIIQSFFRMQHCRQIFIRQKRAACRIEEHWLGLKRTRKLEGEYKVLRQSAICIQRYYRGYRGRKLMKQRKAAIMLIEEHFAAYLQTKSARVEYLRQRECAVKIQAAWRGFVVRRQLDVQKSACIKIQSTWRTVRTSRQYNALRKAVNVIQDNWRCYQVRKERDLIQRRVAQLQAVYRGYRVRKSLKEQHEAALLLQKYYRGHVVRVQLERRRAAALVIQAWFRNLQLTRHTRNHFVKMCECATFIQAHVRGFRLRKLLREQSNAACFIQSSWRMYNAQKAFQRTKAAAITVQVFYRACLASRRVRDEYIDTRRKVILIQSYTRGMLVRRELRREHAAAALIQASYRMSVQRKKYVQMKDAAVTIQTYVRMAHERRKYKIMRRSAIQIQAAVRMWQGRRQYARTVSAVIRIQAAVRGYQQRCHYLDVTSSAIIIQKHFRGFKARYTIFTALRIKRLHELLTSTPPPLLKVKEIERALNSLVNS